MIKYKNQDIAEIRIGVGGGAQPFDFASIGYTGEEESIKSDLTYAQKIKNEWDPNQTSMGLMFYQDKQLVYFPLVDTSNVTNLSYTFRECEHLTTIPKLDTSNVIYMSKTFELCSKLTTIPLLNTSNVTSMDGMFSDCRNLTTIPKLDTSSVTNMDGMFGGCTNLTTIPKLDTSSVTNMDYMFYMCLGLTTIPKLDTSKVTSMNLMFDQCGSLTSISLLDLSSCEDITLMFGGCVNLKSVVFKGNPSKITYMDKIFGYNKNTQHGTLIYDYGYDYTAVINKFKEQAPNWTFKSSYEPTECTSLSITADDCVGNDTTTTIHYTAVTNGINIFTQEPISNITITGDVKSDPFEMNPSYTDSRQVEVSFTYLGQTATATITQGPYMKQSVTVDLMNNWELAPSDTIPNPDPNLYEGVYQSIHKGVGNANDKMTITFVGVPNFELYIRQNNETEAPYDYLVAGKLDQTDPTDSDCQATTKSNSQAGTDIGSYTKVEYPNDGDQHTIEIIYKKDEAYDAGEDRGYVFFKKPQN